MDSYNPQKIEAKWRKIWEKNKTFQVDLKRAKSPYYNLMMFPYPSAEGLHVGNVYAFTGSDIHGRFKKMQGNDVFEPMGFDAFGIHSENFAIKKGIHPKILIKKNTDNFREQLKNLGGLFDWSHEVDTTKPEYYKWTQWLFLQLFKAGLAFRKKAPVDWCPSCKTVLADEQVISGKCERCDSQVIQKETEQWFFKITKYAEKLLKNLEKIDWSERTKIAQKNWIGKSEGAKIEFRIKNLEFRVEVFTTRPDTLFGCTYLVISPEHSMVQNIESRIKNIEEVQNYIKEAKRKSELERTDLAKEKTGVELKGIRAINPANNEEIPVFVADYVLASYGTGAIMAVPAHDQRDFEFAEKFKLKVVQVIAPLLKTTEGSDAVREDKKTEKRNTIYAFVKHWKEDKYLCLNWPKYNWHSSIIGGIEGGEDAMRAGLREIKEETGYKNVKLVKKLNTEIHSYYYAGHKEVNRYSIGYCGLYQLVDDQREEPDPEDIKNHETIWIDGKKMSEFLNLNNNILMWQMLMSGNDCFAGNGILINSGKFNEKDSETVKGEIIKSVGGKKTINYHLRDWLISRQRYWGPPIPIIYCKKCGTVPVPEKDLPVLLPFVKNFRPKNTGESPLASVPSFVKTKCPQCKGPAKRETDVSDTFLDSSWYFFRYPSTDFKNKPFDEIITKKWLPVDMYIGGQEHAVLHLLYTRFITMALKDAGFIDFEEPFKKFRVNGLLTKEGVKMSKSKGNVVNPDDYFKKFGADTLRMYLMFLGPFSEGGDWSDAGIIGISRFLNKVWGLKNITGKPNEDIEKLMHQTIKKVTEDIENLRYNTAISSLMILANAMEKQEQLSVISYQLLLKLLAPFAPYITEELWQQLGNKNSIHSQEWPEYDPKLIKEDIITLVVQINGKFRDKIEVKAGISQNEAERLTLGQERIKQLISGKSVKKIIFVPNKLINVVI